MPSPVRFSPISTPKPSRLSSSATSRASLMGSLSGASASGYLASPMTSAKRSAAAADRLTGITAKIEIISNAKQILIRRESSQPGADPSLRLGDLTLRKVHYQTAVATRQPLVESGLSRQLTAASRPPFKGNKSRPNCRPAAWPVRDDGNVIGLTLIGCNVIRMTVLVRPSTKFDLCRRQWLAGRIGCRNQEK